MKLMGDPTEPVKQAFRYMALLAEKGKIYWKREIYLWRIVRKSLETHFIEKLCINFEILYQNKFPF